MHIPEGPNYKVSPKFAGPFRINKVLPYNKYEIIHETSLMKKIAYWNHLKITSSNPCSKNELDLINDEIEDL